MKILFIFKNAIFWLSVSIFVFNFLKDERPSKIEVGKMQWYKHKNLNQGLPQSIQVFVSDSSWTPGQSLFSAYALIDLQDPDIGFKIAYGNPENPVKTPMQFYEEEKHVPYIVINGGYFYVTTGESKGLIIHDSQLVTVCQQNQANYHPTIGAFGMYANKSLEATWIFNLLDSYRTTYSYPQPAPNNPSDPPLPIPNKTYPSGGQPWNVQEGISAGPLLLKDGKYYNGSSELFGKPIMDMQQPRTAICSTKDKKLILFVADGRRIFSSGLFLNETAALLSSLGCVDAINLDGGGSSCLISNGIEANHPSAGIERQVANAIVIYNLNKYKQNNGK